VTETTLTSSFPLTGVTPWAANRRATFGWSISWLPAITLLLSDLLAWPAIFLIFSQVRDLVFHSPGQVEWHILLLPGVATAAVLQFVNGYERRTPMASLGYTVEHILGLGIAVMISAVAVYGFVSFGDLVKPSRSIFFINFFAFGLYTLYSRRWLTSALNSHHSRRSFLLIADPKSAASFYEVYRSQKMVQELKCCTVDRQFVGLPVKEGETAGPRFIGDVFGALAALNEESDGVIVGIRPSELDPQLAQVLAYLHFRHIPVYTLESFYEIQWKKVPVQSIEAWWAFAKESLLTRDSIYDQVKRCFDFIGSLIAIVLLSPVLVAVGVLIRLESKGPAIFRQMRIGRDGRPFTLYKFRSMRVGSDRGPIYTAQKDCRITRLGSFLRKTRIDELPQLFNVFRGEMSIIGPRAEWDKCVERYEGKIPFYCYRHLVRPGITGWAQVNYPYGANDLDALEKLKFDLYYIRNYSLSLDIAIVLKTLHIMLFAKGR
jgi:exopolysaccharide biosynthesis polyprenyl glycosylphosphotransferase